MNTKPGSPFQRLQSVLTDYSEDGNSAKAELLKQCSLFGFPGAKRIRHYHDTLLFLLSYAANTEIKELAEKEMRRLTAHIAAKPALKDALAGSGIAGTVTRGAYSLTLTAWLLREFPGNVSLHSFDADAVHPKEILKHALPEAEFELVTEEKLNALKWLEKASGTRNRVKNLAWLMHLVNTINAASLIKDQLFESLKLFIEIDPGNPEFSRSYGKVNLFSSFLHPGGIIKRFSETELINKPLPPEKKLNEQEKTAIIKASRTALCLLNRETDPITYSKELNINYFELERGLSIALFSIDAERRLPVESYIGFMMFKNGYPMSYGGAWLFGKRSLIGINIFEAFRGGESAIVFAQLLRCYHMEYGATYFEVEPYQFGKNNPEGIQSGAFWFYYRFGFRPCDKALHELSLSEHNKITASRGYKSPADILKQFTRSNLFVNVDHSTDKPINPADLSKFVTHKINKDFKGDRGEAYKWCTRELKKEKVLGGKEDKRSLDKLVLFLGLCLDLEKIPSSGKSLLQKMLQTKTASEFEYIKALKNAAVEKYLATEVKEFLL